MNDALPMTDPAASESERNVLLVAYVLYALEPFSLGITAVIGVILNHLKVNDTSNLFVRSHHVWLLRTFWYTLLWTIVCALPMVTIVLIPLCWIGFGVIAIWHLYRIIRGGLNFFERRPMPV